MHRNHAKGRILTVRRGIRREDRSVAVLALAVLLAASTIDAQVGTPPVPTRTRMVLLGTGNPRPIRIDRDRRPRSW